MQLLEIRYEIETDQTLAKQKIGYDPKFDLKRGIDAYHASGKLGNA